MDKFDSIANTVLRKIDKVTIKEDNEITANINNPRDLIIVLNFLKTSQNIFKILKDDIRDRKKVFKWVDKNNIKEFILITSNYHMPRAILEFKNVMPNLKIHTYVIIPKKHDIKNWFSSYQTFSLVLLEYCKYIIANLRIKIFST